MGDTNSFRMTTKELAKLYQTTPRTIHRWKADGAPIHDEPSMREWISAVRNRDSHDETAACRNAEADNARSSELLSRLDDTICALRIHFYAQKRLHGETLELFNSVKQGVVRLADHCGAVLVNR